MELSRDAKSTMKKRKSEQEIGRQREPQVIMAWDEAKNRRKRARDRAFSVRRLPHRPPYIFIYMDICVDDYTS